MIDIERIAHVCHEANRALQVTGGEEPSPHFFNSCSDFVIVFTARPPGLLTCNN